MSDDLIVTAYVVIDEMMQALGHRSHGLAHVSDAEVLTLAIEGLRAGVRVKAATPETLYVVPGVNTTSTQ